MAKVDYQAILEAAWHQHLAPRESDAPTVISTFAGCGGSSLGYSMAGFRELLAVEWDDNAVATFRLNFPDVPVYHGDIAKLTIEECLQLAGVGPGELDVLDGSPPCQGFSTAGKRQLEDSRNGLFREYVRLLRGLKPRVFVMENVSGMVKGKMKLVFAEAMRELKTSGYRVSARLMNAMYFHVPQARERLIFIGVREDLHEHPTHPKPQCSPISLRDALMNVVITETPKFNDRYARLWSQISTPTGKRLTSSAAMVIGKGYNSCVKPNPNMPCCTLPKTQTGRGFATIAHWHEPRALSIAEAKRITSFPDEMMFTGPYSVQWERIGNSVPPLFMHAIAEHVRREILDAENA